MGRLDEARSAIDRAIAHARTARYERGRISCELYLADVAGLGGDLEAAARLVAGALPRLADYDVFDLGCLEVAARHHRLRGDLGRADRQLGEALERSARFPMLHAMMRLESARLALAFGHPGEETRHRAAANALFEANGLERRVLGEPVREHGTQFREPIG
jgi:ATP/maltotriose-dependent transcriptional regulator MalT